MKPDRKLQAWSKWRSRAGRWLWPHPIKGPKRPFNIGSNALKRKERAEGLRKGRVV